MGGGGGREKRIHVSGEPPAARDAGRHGEVDQKRHVAQKVAQKVAHKRQKSLRGSTLKAKELKGKHHVHTARVAITLDLKRHARKRLPQHQA